MFKDIKIAFFGNSKFSLIVLEELKKLGILPNIIITTPDKPQGRKMILTPTPTKTWAEGNSIEFIEANKLKDPQFLNKISEYNLFIVASYGKIIPKDVLDIPKYKTLNIHPSLLPKYRGPSPLQYQILNDDQLAGKNIGVSIMLVDEQVDHGPTLAQEKIDIPSWPIGFNKLEELLAQAGSRLLAKILPEWIKGKIKAGEQRHTDATFTKKIEKNDGLIELLPENQNKNYLKILAYENWPQTYFFIPKKEKQIKVIIKLAEFKNNELKILRVLPEGKKEMNYEDFLRGIK